MMNLFAEMNMMTYHLKHFPINFPNSYQPVSYNECYVALYICVPFLVEVRTVSYYKFYFIFQPIP